MKYLKQLAIIFLICVVGQGISILIDGVIPGNVLAMILLLVLLLTGIMKPSTIEATADFILANMAFLFVPPTVAIIDAYEILAGNILKILVICILTTILTSLSAGYTVKFVLKLQNKRRKS